MCVVAKYINTPTTLFGTTLHKMSLRLCLVHFHFKNNTTLHLKEGVPCFFFMQHDIFRVCFIKHGFYQFCFGKKQNESKTERIFIEMN